MTRTSGIRRLYDAAGTAAYAPARAAFIAAAASEPDAARHIARADATDARLRTAHMCRTVSRAVSQHLAPRSRVLDAAILHDLFGLTTAESALANALVTTRTLPAAAGACGIKKETARTYLKRIFEKTGTNRQAGLLRVLLSLRAST